MEQQQHLCDCDHHHQQEQIANPASKILESAKEEQERELAAIKDAAVVKSVDDAFRQALDALVARRVDALLRGGDVEGDVGDQNGEEEEAAPSTTVQQHFHFHYHQLPAAAAGSPAAAAQVGPSSSTSSSSISGIVVETLEGFTESTAPSSPASHVTVEEAMEVFHQAFNETMNAVSPSLQQRQQQLLQQQQEDAQAVLALRRQQERIAELTGISGRHIVSNFSQNLAANTLTRRRSPSSFGSNNRAAGVAALPLPPLIPPTTVANPVARTTPAAAAAVRQVEQEQVEEEEQTENARAADIRALRQRGAVSRMGDAFRSRLEAVLRSGTLVMPSDRTLVRRPSDSPAAAQEPVATPSRTPSIRAQPQPEPQPQAAPLPAAYEVLLGRFSFPSEIRDIELQQLEGRAQVTAILRSSFAGRLERLLRERAARDRARAARHAHAVVPEDEVVVAPVPAPAPAPRAAPHHHHRQQRAAAPVDFDPLLGRFSFASEIRDIELQQLEGQAQVTAILRSSFAGRLERLLRERAARDRARAARHAHVAPAAAPIAEEAAAAPPPLAAAPAVAAAPVPAMRGMPVRWSRDRILQMAGGGQAAAAAAAAAAVVMGGGAAAAGASAAGGRAFAELQATVMAMREQMNEMRGLVSACVEMQMDLQRSIRQECAGAMQTAARADPAAFSASIAQSERSNSLRGDNCMICVDKVCDAVFYRCGHMCVCYGCAKDLQRREIKCPVCRAEIVDVIRAYPA